MEWMIASDSSCEIRTLPDTAPGVQFALVPFKIRVGERVLVAINAAGETYHADFNAGCGTAVDLITGQPHDFGGGSDLPPCSCAFWRMEH